MSTEPETTENAEPGAPDTAAEDAGAAQDAAPVAQDGAGAEGGPGAAGGGAADAGNTAGGGSGAARGSGGQGAEGGGADPGAAEDAAPGEDGAAVPGAGSSEAADADARDGDDPAADARDGEDPDADARDGEDPDADAGDGEAAGEGSGDGEAAGEGAEGGGTASEMSEAEAELAAQRIERERIERRKAERKGRIESGSRLTGRAADLLAAVRAVESGATPPATVFAEPEPQAARRRPAPQPVRRPGPVSAEAAAAAPAAPAPQTVQAVRQVLADGGGAPEALALPAAAALGPGAHERLREDPWQLLRVTGVRPEQADGFARSLLGAECGPGDPRRGRAFTVWLLEQAALAGHTCLEAPALVEALARRGVPDPDAALQETLAEGEALVFQDALEEPGAPAARGHAQDTSDDGTEGGGDGEEDEDAARPVRVLVGLERYALAEESLADGLARLVNSAPDGTIAAQDWEQAAGPARGSAAELIRAVAAHGLVLYTGGEASRVDPARLLCAARALGLHAWAATHSPLGREAFAELLRQQSPQEGGRAQGPSEGGVATVAGLLSGAEGPGRDADGTLDLDLLVVLDAPQLDVETAALLVESLPDGARLVLAGDPAVLWSVGPGRVFADLLAARVCPHVASRVPDPGPLGELVSGIGIGELNQVEAPGKEVVIVPVRDAGEAVHRTVQLVSDSVPRAIGVPAEQTVVITPGHGGAAGTRVLNAALKERLNPGPGRFGGFDPGDRIAYSPVPGRTLPGHVVKADADGLHLSCAGAPVVVPREQVETRVRHGWALTAHQAVGGRWPAVVVVLPGDAAQALTRPWVYTAFGRATRHMSVVHGAEQALPRAVAEVPAKPRTTRLPVLLRTQEQQAA
ncbi:helix-hairpin-helix domain-containing protein [Streptomyces mexicanus]|uniref:ATP-binding domain-containing protein n=1 Tax=Streptomyces mexicanus TaxID=178566 RepID=A0A7X1I1R1_9ACTN|nr:helix-hairpin-helix domain-containing protein [Streptomyces mexicanus]MBC2866675.1 ATP-binding domain-containing protein [Streptomyces mexicanus]